MGMRGRRVAGLCIVMAALLFPGVASAAPAESAREQLTLAVGGQRVLPVKGLVRVAIGDAAIADVKPIGGAQVLVVGKAEGSTSLMVWQEGGRQRSWQLTVRSRVRDEVVEEAARLLRDTPSLKVRAVGEQLLLEGNAATPEAAARLDQVRELFPAVKVLATVTPEARRPLAEAITARLHGAGYRGTRVEIVDSTLFLEGDVESEQELQRVERILRAMSARVENLLAVGSRRMILAEVQFVEVRRANDDRLGAKLPLDITAGIDAQVAYQAKTLGGAGTSPAEVIVKGSSELSLQALFTSGSARLLAQPRLVCASGEKAEFLAGGEMPIPMTTANSFSVEYKPFGIKLSLRPTADRDGRILSEIEAEASEVDRAVSVTSGASVAVPGFRTRRVKTNVSVQSGETIVMSGIFEFDEQKSVTKVPLLGHIPVLGELFKSRSMASIRRELLIFVTPRVVDPGSERIKALLDESKGHYRDAEGTGGVSLWD